MRQPVRLNLWFTALVCLTTIWFGRWNNAPYQTDLNIIRGDGQGFYAWLPAFFIHDDLSFEFYNDSTLNIEGFFSNRFLNEHDGKTILKTPCGEAVMLAPFFLANYILRTATGKISTGYEGSFQKAVSIGALFYYILGLYFFSLILRRFVQNEIAIALTVLLLAFGTNLFYYAIHHPTMTHVYSFALIASFVWLLFRFDETKKYHFIRLAATVFGLIYLVRPVNMIILATVPLICGNWKNTMHFIRGVFIPVEKFLVALVLFASVVFIQFGLNKMQCGDWFAWSYKNEGFNFLEPKFLSVLFSFNKGLFIYTPLVIVSIAGLFVMAKQSAFRAVSYLTFFVFITWIISSWWNWHYGSGFGMRPMVDFYAVLFIPLVFLLEQKGRVLTMTMFISTLLVGLNLFQTWQFNQWIIHPEEMNAGKYAYVFLRTGGKYENCLGGGNEDPMRVLKRDPVFSTSNDFEVAHREYWNEGKTCEVDEMANGGFHACCFNDSILYSSTLTLPANSKKYFEEDFYIEVTLDRWEDELHSAKNAVLVYTYFNLANETTWWNKLSLNDWPRDEFAVWRKAKYSLRMPKMEKGNACKIYVYNPEGKKFRIDNFKVDVFVYGDWDH